MLSLLLKTKEYDSEGQIIMCFYCPFKIVAMALRLFFLDTALVRQVTSLVCLDVKYYPPH